MTDLTKINKPFGELDRETQLALFEAWLDGTPIKLQRGHDKLIYHPFGDKEVYTLPPRPDIPDSIDWGHVHPDYKYMARCKSGRAYLYSAKPVKGVTKWFSTGSTVCMARYFASYKRGNVPWDESLVIRPGVEE